MKKLKYLVWVVILLVLSSYNIEAKVSNKDSENFANVVIFGYFSGNESTIDRQYLIDNSEKLINLYNGTNGRSVTNYLKNISYVNLILRIFSLNIMGKILIHWKYTVIKMMHM